MKLVLLILAALASAKSKRSPINRLNKIKKQAFAFLDGTFKQRVAEHWKPKFERFIEGTKRRAIKCGIPAGRTKRGVDEMLMPILSRTRRAPPKSAAERRIKSLSNSASRWEKRYLKDCKRNRTREQTKRGQTFYARLRERLVTHKKAPASE
ncbi:Oidioi.mRNA.OKI2018_I69.PAR.g11141.t1.cds [Oikopleura dioica]|uniref:Oidioi.mRNA.OKI2018_I69.PAR.g11141.t1.cds n=1 Tax=Oikopleura dioica TaxID=34765 RepID=A0ABN7RXH7_OIKDI|nr:Oidioi.mRNA.OKI2018_I69.PAR.g11141.t1.cds [Oikopleura dioica]